MTNTHDETPDQATEQALDAPEIGLCDALRWHAAALETAADDLDEQRHGWGFVTVHQGVEWRVETRATPLDDETPAPDPHDGITCEQIEAILTVREKQLTEARQRLTDEPRAVHPAALVRAVTDARRAAREARADADAARAERDAILARLLAREDQARHRLTPEEEQAEKLAAVAAVEAYRDGRIDDLQRVAPTTLAACRAHLVTLTTALADVAAATPGLLDDLRATLVADDEEEQA